MNITVIIVELQTGLFDVLSFNFPWTKWVVDELCYFFEFLFLLLLTLCCKILTSYLSLIRSENAYDKKYEKYIYIYISIRQFLYSWYDILKTQINGHLFIYLENSTTKYFVLVFYLTIFFPRSKD